MRCDVHLAVGHVGPSLEFVGGHDGRLSEGVYWLSVGASDSVGWSRRRREEERRAVGRKLCKREERAAGWRSEVATYVYSLVDVFQKSKSN